MKRLTDPTFKYFNSADTCLKRTFARVRAEMKRAESKPNVVPMKKAAK